MNYALIVENSGQRSIHKVVLNPDESIAVGRAWQNDIIVDDEYVDARHIEISSSSEGQLSIEDLNSRNGTHVDRAAIAAKTGYPSGSVINLGETTIMLHQVETDVAAALARDAVHSANRAFGTLAWVLVASLLAGLAALLNIYWLSTEEVNSELLATGFLGIAVLFCAWCLIAGMVSKIFRNKIFGKLHWIFISLLFTLQVFSNLLLDFLRFNLDSSISDTLLTDGILVASLCLLVYGALSLCTRIAKSSKLATTCTLIAMVLIFKYITPMLADEHELWTANANISRVNLPPKLLVVAPTTLEKHSQKTSDLFTELEKKVSIANAASLNSPRATESLKAAALSVRGHN